MSAQGQQKLPEIVANSDDVPLEVAKLDEPKQCR